jgi:hypothetical protein
MKRRHSDIEQLLFGTNYTVFLADYSGETINQMSLNDNASRLIGDPVKVGGSSPVTMAEINEEIRRCISYKGDDSHGPVDMNAKKGIVDKWIDEYLSWINRICDGSTMITQFWLKSGHPAYPVFWDYAYFIEQNNASYILIGSSSD